MNLRRNITALLLAASVTAAALTGCDTVGTIEYSSETQQSSSEESASADISETTADASVSHYPEYPVTYPEIQQQDTGDLYEAENYISGDLTTASSREGYSGSGYATGFSDDGTNSVTFTVNAPSNQHYDLSFCIASDTAVSCTVNVNDSRFGSFDTKPDESGAFTVITLYGAFLVTGESQISIQTSGGNIDLDYLKITNNTTISDIVYEADDSLSNEQASDPAKKLMSFLSENYGNYIITGQYASDETNSELDLIYRTTGKYPVIRFAAFSNADESFDSCDSVISASSAWYEKGGIIGLMWHWESPGDTPSVYSKDTDFKLANAVTDTDISSMTQEEILALYNNGTISQECYEIILDIDAMSEKLAVLNEKGVPVLWRPLHEGSGDWFWWGAKNCGVDAYKWLWDLMYKRMTNYFNLNNLIWIWNGQSVDTLVDESEFDIAALDIYESEGTESGSHYDQFAALQKLVGTDKLIALSECSSAPDIDSSFRDNARWSFFGLWYGKYLEDDNGEYSEKYMSKDSFIRAYNSSGALTLDEYISMQNQGST